MFETTGSYFLFFGMNLLKLCLSKESTIFVKNVLGKWD